MRLLACLWVVNRVCKDLARGGRGGKGGRGGREDLDSEGRDTDSVR